MHDPVHDFALEASKGWCSTVQAGSQSEDIQAIHLSIISRSGKSLGLGSISLDVLANCKHLSVLVMEDKLVHELPNFIVGLKDLRYLHIFGTSIEMLPKSVKLYNLQTLRVHKLLELPRDFENLVELRHFYISEGNQSLLIPGIRKLTSLRTLPHFVVSQERRSCHVRSCKPCRILEVTSKYLVSRT